MLLLLLPYSWPLYSSLYFSFSHQNLLHPLLVGFIITTLFFITSHLRILLNCPWFSHSVQILKSLHWLRVQSRIIFRFCTIAYQTLSSGEPSYLFSMLSLSPKPRELRSSSFHLLSVPRVKTHAGTHAFSVAVPTLWNSLSEHVKSSNRIISFYYHFKTNYLFRLVYPSYVFTASDHLLMNFASYLDFYILFGVLLYYVLIICTVPLNGSC